MSLYSSSGSSLNSQREQGPIQESMLQGTKRCEVGLTSCFFSAPYVPPGVELILTYNVKNATEKEGEVTYPSPRLSDTDRRL